MNIRSLFYLPLAILATTFVPGIRASEAPAPTKTTETQDTWLHLQLGFGETRSFHDQQSFAIIAKLLLTEERERLEKMLENPAVNISLSTEAQNNYEAIKILHLIELHKVNPEQYGDKTSKGLREIGTGTDLNPKQILEDNCWKPTKKALDYLQGSHASYAILCEAIRQVMSDQDKSKNTTEAEKRALEQLAIPCLCYFTATSQTPSKKQDSSTSISEQQAKRDQEAVSKLIGRVSKPTATQATLRDAETLLGSMAMTDNNEDAVVKLNVLLTKKNKERSAPKTEQAAEPVLPTQAQTTPTQATATINNTPVQLNFPSQPPQKPAFTLVDSSKQNEIPQPASKPADTKFINRPWVKYGIFVLAAAALIYSGYHVYRSGNLRALAKLVKIRA